MFKYEEAITVCEKYFNGDSLASKVFLDKYALKNNDGDLLENSPEMMHRRIAKEFARIEKNKFKEPLTEREIFGLLDGFLEVLPQGSPMFGIGNDYQIISLSNCYLLDVPLDNYNSILDVDKQLVNICKRRGGVGIDLSNLRPTGSSVNNAAKSSSGMISWMERYSNSIREVAQSGRRGALMLTLSINHPDILAFCTVKNDPTKVTGANISVRLNQEFLDAVKNDTDYELRWPVDSKTPKVSKTVSAKMVWDTIINSAWGRAEPGLLMWDNVTTNTPADYYENYRSMGTNPCCHAASKDVFVNTNNGVKEIKTVTSDDQVDVGYGNFVKNSGYFSVGVAEVYQVGFSNDDVFYVTRDHKFMTPTQCEYGEPSYQLTPLALLKPGDIVLAEENGITIKYIQFYKIEEVGCINVPQYGYFKTKSGLFSGNSEINLSPLDSCRLMAINLLSYVKAPYTEKASFDFNTFKGRAKIAQRLMDDMVDLESEKIDKIIDKIESDPEPQVIKSPEIDMWRRIKRFNDEGRRTGTGITALGDTLAALGIKYGSEESIEVTGEIYKTLKLGCYESSVEMAEELGAFKDWDHEKEKDCPIIDRIKEEDPKLYKRMAKSGRRNISLTTTAPTGSLSILTQTTSGIEPLFMLGYTRRRKINAEDGGKADFVDQNGDKWEENTVYHTQIAKWMEVTGKTDVKESPWYGACAEDIDWINRVKLQAAAQLHVDHAISSTINLPEDVSKETVAKIYQTAFESGCKGITVYRKNCRTGVLIEKPEKKLDNSICQTVAPKRPKLMNCDVHHLTYEGKRYYAVVGLLNEPYEIFVGLNSDSEGDVIVPKSIKAGTLTKEARKKYILEHKDSHFSCDISNGHTDENADVLGRLISTSLRHGTPIEFIVHQLEKTHGGLTSFSKILCRTLKKYIKEGAKVYGEKCQSCGSENIQRTSGCVNCMECSWSKCG